MKQRYITKTKKTEAMGRADRNRAILDDRLGSTEAKAMLDKLSENYLHPVPSAKEVRAMLDNAMGRRTLTGELHKLRQEKPE